jgi:hypothetical protein
MHNGMCKDFEKLHKSSLKQVAANDIKILVVMQKLSTAAKYGRCDG